MKTVTVNAFAKVNLFLDIVGQNDGYHMLDSVVVTIDLKDKITLTKRRDDKIVLKQRDGLYSVGIADESNNAYKAAKLFMERFNTSGVDIALKKNIPIGSGLGGSSADISGVLNGMKQLYDIEEDIKPLADALGSDSGYLLTGGYARLKGRGEIVEELSLKNKLYMVIIPADGGVNTAECFKLCDSLSQEIVPNGADRLITALEGGFYDRTHFYNALYKPATVLNKNVANAYEDLLSLSPRAVCMSGSGSSVFAIFDTPEFCLWAEKKLKRKYPNLILSESLTKAELNKTTKSIYNI